MPSLALQCCLCFAFVRGIPLSYLFIEPPPSRVTANATNFFGVAFALHYYLFLQLKFFVRSLPLAYTLTPSLSLSPLAFVILFFHAHRNCYLCQLRFYLNCSSKFFLAACNKSFCKLLCLSVRLDLCLDFRLV